MRSPKRLLLLVAAAVAIMLVVVVVLVTSGGGGTSSRQASGGAGFSPVVRYTGRAPTGYTVTFRYRAPSAKSVLIQGEWYFSNPALTTPTSSQGLLPARWKPGDVATGWPGPSTPDGWPVVSMKKDPGSGVWSYTTPLPSGYYNYGFYVNCTIGQALAGPTGAPNCPGAEVSDPSNPPWNDHNGISSGSADGRSQVYVPADPAFDHVSYSWEAPMSPKGTLTDVSYHSVAGAAAPDHRGVNFLAIYTPAGYDPHRSTPYPTLYLSPGAGLNEVDWSTQGDAANIIGRLIGQHQIKPMVVVMTNTGCPNGASYCDGITPSDYDRDLLDAVIPYVQGHYDVSRAPSERAFAGFSFGGYLAGGLITADASKFGYFGLFSPCPAPVTAPAAARVAAIRHDRVMVGGGLQDPECHIYAVEDLAVLHNAGANDVTEFFYGGHDWNVWRRLLRDFLTRVAFKPAGG